MAAVKWIFVVIFSLGAVGALATGFTAGVPRDSQLATQQVIALRPFPNGTVVASAKLAVPSEPVAAAEPKPTEPVAVPEPKPSEPVAAVEPKEPKAEPKVEPKPVEVKAAEPKPAEPVAVAKPAEPKPVAAAPAPVAAPPPVAKAPPAEGLLNLRASDTADVYLDGKKLGGSPLLGIKAKAGNHKVRFDCYDAAGNTIAGPTQIVVAKANEETDFEFPCPTE